MTKINKLIIRGFKSFAKHTEIQFGDRFNCVLGPNGAGKSNVLDALCFVLGRSSSKALRAEKSANLIYNGGKSKKGAKEAEVSIVLDNSEKEFAVDDPEVKVTRIVRQNGQSIYKINEQKRTRHEILELLLMAHIEAEGYNVILQGDIVKFVEMTPVDRRLLIDEISGIRKYEEKRNQALRNLEKVDDRIKEAEIILSERDVRLKELKKERDQAAKYKNLHDKIDQNKATYIFKQIERKAKQKEEFDADIAKHNEKLSKVQKKIDDLKGSIRDKKKTMDEINAEIESKGEVEQVSMHKEVEELKVELAKSENRVDFCNGEIKRVGERKDQLEKSVSEISGKMERLAKEKAEIQKQIITIQKEQDILKERIAKFKKKNDIDAAYEHEKRIEEIDKALEIKEKEIGDMRSQQQELLRKKDKFDFEIEKIDEQIAKIAMLQKENADQLEKLKGLKQEFKKTTLELNKMLNDSSSYSARLGDARKKLIDTGEQLAKLTAKNIGIQESLSSNMGLQKILESKIRGIHGTVASLGKVSQKYSLALEIAAGTKTRSVVVDDDKVAAACISYLKKNKYGVVTFLPLNKIKGKPKLDEIRSSGVHGLAQNLVNYDSRYKDVFSYVFGNTIVVDTIDVARKIGIGKAKMVTLDGDAAEMSGAMQGGYRGKSRKGMGFVEKELTDDIDKLEKQKNDYEGIVMALERRKTESEDGIARLREFKANLEGDIIKLEKSLHLESSDTDATKDVKRNLKSETDSADKEITSLNLKISSKNSELAKLKIEKQSLRNKINELRNPVLLAELNTFEEKKDELSQKMMGMNGDIKNIDAQVVNILKPELGNLERVSKQQSKEIEEFQNEIKTRLEEIKDMKADLKIKEKKQKEFYEKFKDLFAKRTKLNDEVNRHSSDVDIFFNEVRAFEQKIAAISAHQAQVKTEISMLEQDFEQYKDVELRKDKSEADLKREISQFENMVSNLGSVNMRSLEIYDEVEKEYKALLEKKEKLRVEREDVLVMIHEIDTKKKDLFMKTFDNVREEFSRIFGELSKKGEAHIELENEENPFEGGVRIKVRLTSTKYLDIRSLSGGEKTLTALAFIFCIQEYEPASFYIFDEVDAALDKKNSEKLARLVSKYSDKAQYIIISHNDSIISEADCLFGVSMNEHGESNLVSLKL